MLLAALDKIGAAYRLGSPNMSGPAESHPIDHEAAFDRNPKAAATTDYSSDRYRYVRADFDRTDVARVLERG